MRKVRQLSSETIAHIIALKIADKQTKEIANQLQINDHVVKCYVARWREGAMPIQPRNSSLVGLIRSPGVLITLLERPREMSSCFQTVKLRKIIVVCSVVSVCTFS